MKVSVKRINDDYLMEAKGASGVPVLMDHSGAEKVQGASPMELLLMGVGGCSAIDIIDIFLSLGTFSCYYHKKGNI